MTDHGQRTQLQPLTRDGAAFPVSNPDRKAIVGHREMTRTVSAGLFVCPTEQTERAYWHYRVRDWVTLFSIPIVPGEVVNEYVECFCCGASVHPGILHSDHPALGRSSS